MSAAWAVQAVRESREREESNMIRSAKALQDRQTLNHKTPFLCSNVTGVLASKVEEFNSESEIGRRLSVAGRPLGFTLARPMRKAVVVGEFANDRLIIAGKNGLRFDAEWRVKVTADGLDLWLFDRDGSPAELEALAIDLIRRLLEQTDGE